MEQEGRVGGMLPGWAAMLAIRLPGPTLLGKERTQGSRLNCQGARTCLEAR